MSAGITPALIGSGVAWGTYFLTYNAAKQRWVRSTGNSHLGPSVHLLCAAEAGALVCFVTNPIWVVKTRLQLQMRERINLQVPRQQLNEIERGIAGGVHRGLWSRIIRGRGTGVNPLSMDVVAAGDKSFLLKSTPLLKSVPHRYSGFFDCLATVARTEGLAGLYKGLLPSLLLVSHGAIQFAVYEELKHAASNMRSFVQPLSGSDDSSSGRTASSSKHNGQLVTSAEITAFGALSKLAASLVTYPSQVIRARLQQRMDARILQYSGVFDVIQTTLAREGLGGLYKGLVPNVLRVMPQSALTMLVYETVVRSL